MRSLRRDEDSKIVVNTAIRDLQAQSRGDQPIEGNPIFSGTVSFTGTVRFDSDALGIWDTNATHRLILTPGSDLTADRVLTITTGDAARTVTFAGNPTLNDWFDQSVKTTANPQFATIELGAAIDTTISRTGAGAIAVEGSAVHTDANTPKGATVIASGSLSGSSVSIINIPGDYAYLSLRIPSWSQDTNTSRLLVRVDSDNGASFDSTAGNYAGFNIDGTTVTNWATNASASLTDGATQLISEGGYAVVNIYGYNTGPYKQSSSIVSSPAGSFTHCIGGYFGNVNAINAIQITTSAAGSFDAGTYDLYGIR